MTNETNGSPDGGHGLPSVDEVIDSARDLSGVERPILPPDPAIGTRGAPASGASVGLAMADAGHGVVAATAHGDDQGLDNAAPSAHGAAPGHAASAPDGHAGGHLDPHGAHDPRDTNLGPPDLESWSAGILGVMVALAVAICFALGTGALAT